MKWQIRHNAFNYQRNNTTTYSFHFDLLKWKRMSKRMSLPCTGKDLEQFELHILLAAIQNAITIQRNSLDISWNIKCTPTLWLRHFLPSHLLWERKTKKYVWILAFMWLLLVVLFVMAPNWKQLRCPWIGERITKL